MTKKKQSKIKQCAKRIGKYAEEIEGAASPHEVLRLSLLIHTQLSLISANTR